MEIVPLGFGVPAIVGALLAALDGDGDAVAVPPPQAAMTAVAPASFRNLRRSSSGVIRPLPRSSRRYYARDRPTDHGRGTGRRGASQPRRDASAGRGATR